MNRFFDLTGKVAVVTGGNGGIGLGIAEGLAQAGAKLAIIGRNAEKSKTAAKVLSEQTGSEPLVLTADVAKPNEVNAILPGWFVTELTERARTEVSGLYERVLGRIPSGRWAQPKDIAGTAVWLASPASDYVTGIAVSVDGGYSS